MTDDEERARDTFFAARDLDDVSVEELQERIAALHAEIARLEAAVERKKSVLNAADSVFKR
ncbi:DUF1192 domain-containing protein [Minwuia thermotolerans]|jgi:uncharacterized small protein (DUF1192 family)|uniref:DUF1192 domain-containing protein n=1 Tax=Minwuia thermotolerans TaxID=2056226 RepID=A0A2M9FYE8_9PROT|nr:DUF1192 domain-containing protein [Minwuia thermotolerans]PJK28480.1 DUF1192 domain-containing protein [Minwuia thermotolerans]